MLKIRLARVGKKKQPTYRVVVADARAPRDGAYVEIIGHYNPRTNPTTFEIDEDKARDWLSKGAQPTDRLHKLLATRGIVEGRTYASPKPQAEPAQARPAAATTGAATAAAVAEAPPAPASEVDEPTPGGTGAEEQVAEKGGAGLEQVEDPENAEKA